MTKALCHINVTHMKTASIRELKHDTSTVLGWVEAGERVEIQKRGKAVAILSRPGPQPSTSTEVDFMARLHSIYGDRVLTSTATEVISEERGNR